MITFEEARKHPQYSKIPVQVLDSLYEYIDSKVPTGSFLRAVLSNDLSEACARADSECIASLPVLVQFLYNNAPSGCYGTPTVVADWLRKGAAERTAAAAEPPPPQIVIDWAVPGRYRAFKAALRKAKASGGNEDTFVFSCPCNVPGLVDHEFLIGYANYLAEYLETKLPAELH